MTPTTKVFCSFNFYLKVNLFSFTIHNYLEILKKNKDKITQIQKNNYGEKKDIETFCKLEDSSFVKHYT